MTRAVPNQFASLTSPTLPNLDADFTALTPTVVVPCSASGTNAITLTPVANTVSVSAYTDKDRYSFVAAATSTGAVTLAVTGVGNFIKVFKAGGTTQAGSGDIVLGQYYDVAYQASLDSSAGGVVIVSAIAPVATGNFNRASFVSTGTFTAPSNTATTTVYKIIVTGAGGAGACVASAVGAGAGGAGATAIAWLSGLAPSGTVAVTIGSGATGVTATSIGGSGASSSVVFGTVTLTAAGGQGGSTVTDLPGGHGGIATGGFINIAGGFGDASGNGNASGGASYWGGGGPPLLSGAGTAPAAVAPGAGGGSGSTGAGGRSGSGADGIAVFEWIA